MQSVPTQEAMNSYLNQPTTATTTTKPDWVEVWNKTLPMSDNKRCRRIRVIQAQERVMVDIRMFYEDKATKYGVSLYLDEWKKMIQALTHPKHSVIYSGDRIIQLSVNKDGYKITLNNGRYGHNRFVYLSESDRTAIMTHSSEVVATLARVKSLPLL
jgi:Transcriptional Coactivator p15 (PC4)